MKTPPTSSADYTTTPWEWRSDFLAQLVAQVPALLHSQDPETGRFGSGIWIVNDQHALFPLAAAWSILDKANPYYQSPDVLEAIGKGGDALIDAQNEIGKWVFRKKDNSTWGDIFMPWTYSRWVRAYALVKDALLSERQARWKNALLLGFSGIAREELHRIHNIPTHHAMALYVAGGALNHPEWQTQAAEFLHRVVQTQDKAGFWSENRGPVVGYNFVYTDALGVYYGLSHDDVVLPALERSARFHAAMTYPDGSAVETVDERQIYHAGVVMANVGFAWSQEGRGYARQQWERIKQKDGTLGIEAAASYLLYGGPDGQEAIPPTSAAEIGQALVGNQDALAARSRPWFWVLSGYTAPVPTESRWILDRQNLLSVFHDRVGLIVGGGNTKLQPLWSTFTVGDPATWVMPVGEENPHFTPPAHLFHVPTSAVLQADTNTLALTYGEADSPVYCALSVKPDSGDSLRLAYIRTDAPEDVSDVPVAGQVPFMVHVGGTWRTASGRSGTLDISDTLHLTAEDTGGGLEYNGQWRVSVPPGATLHWPVKPFDQYVKDGIATPDKWRLVLSLPLTQTLPAQEIVLSVLCSAATP